MIDEILLQEASQFLKISIGKLKKKYADIQKKYSSFIKWKYLTEEEWLKKDIDQMNEKKVTDFFRKTNNLILESIENHSKYPRKRLTKKVIAIIKTNRLKKVLDYGCGIGQDSIMQAKAGLIATAADLSGKTFNFAKWRFKKYNLSIKTINIFPTKLFLKETYDVVTCFEVMQHLVKPQKVLKYFQKCLKPHGMLLLTTRFKNNSALALKSNEKYENNFEKVVENKGFILEKRINLWPSKTLDIYRKKPK